MNREKGKVVEEMRAGASSRSSAPSPFIVATAAVVLIGDKSASASTGTRRPGDVVIGKEPLPIALLGILSICLFIVVTIFIRAIPRTDLKLAVIKFAKKKQL